MSKIKFFKFALSFCILTFAFLIFGASSVHALTAADQEKIKQLREQIEALEEQKEQLQKTIAKTAAEANTLKNQIDQLKNSITKLQLQIQQTERKISQTALEIVDTEETIYDTQKEMDAQRAVISDLLLYLHKRDNESLVGVLLKSASLSDYFNHEQYALTVNQKLLGVINDLKEAEQELGHHKNNLESKKQDLESLKREQSAQKVSLSGVQADKDQLLKVTKGQEAQYQKMLADIEIKQNVFFTQMRELETQIIQGGLYIVRVKADPLPRKGTKLFSWPETSRRITQGYGCTSYARCGSRRGAYGGAPHNGIDIASGHGSPIYTIGDGEIIANGKNDGWGNWVAIKHPNHYNLVSLYAHMSSLSFLPVGTQIKAGSIIGYEGKTGHVTGSHLHLSLYKEFFTYVNGDDLLFNYFEGSINPMGYL